MFPHLWTVSAAFMYQFVPIPRSAAAEPPEFVYVPMPSAGKSRIATFGQIARWNMLWEARHLRHRIFAPRTLPRALRWLSRYPECDFRLVPLEGETRYAAYASLYHLLPLDVLRRFGLPPIKRAGWPVAYDFGETGCVLPSDWGTRLGRAVAFHLWPFLSPRSNPSMFSRNDPVHVLSHNLDYWMPYLDLVAQRRCLGNGRCAFDRERPDQPAQLVDARRRLLDENCDVERPLMGGPVWMGEAEAREAAAELVDTADARGNLRAIIDAVRAHRIVDDFSSRWSWEREDFERKLYRKRLKIRPVFVEIDKTIPVHGPGAEAEENLLWQDFLALLDVRERRVVVCLRSGVTRAQEIADELGYANHSPVSKALARIRLKVEAFLGN
jgi:hypothetical protein